MKSTKLCQAAVTRLSLALVFVPVLGLVSIGCAASNTDNSGSGGASSTGGSTGSGGVTGSGGTTGSGGSTGSGGTSSGGATGSGGSTATGGTTGSGGSATGSGGSATGGNTGTGGAAGSGETGGAGGHAAGGASGGSGGAGHAGGGSNGAAGTSGGGGSSSSALTLTSMHQADNAKFDSKYTCQESPPLSGKTVGGLGNGSNPDLEWMNAPAGTMSFAITFLDTTLINAGMDSFGNHWAIWNIPATVMTFPEGTTTLSGSLMNAKQSGAFLAPCAQSLMGGVDDQYAFTIYALSTATLNVTGGTGVAQARTALATAMTAGQVLGTAVLHGHAGLMGK